MKIFRLRLTIGVLAILSLYTGCYETGGMSVPTRDFFAPEPKFSTGDDLPPPSTPNTMEKLGNPAAQNPTPASK